MTTSPFDAIWAHYFEAYSRHDAEGCASAFSDNAEVHSPWSPVAIGKEAIAAAHREWFEDGEHNKTYEIGYAQAEGNHGVCLIRFSADVPGERAGTERAHGVSLNAMERQVNGAWAIRICSLNQCQAGHEETRQ